MTLNADALRPRSRDFLRLHYPPALEAQFRADVRSRLRRARASMFAVLAAIFGLAPVYQDALFSPAPSLRPLLVLVQCGLLAPLALAASLSTLYWAHRVATQALQVAAVMAVCSAVVALRALALQGALAYPSQMIGIALIAVAFFGGFSWRRVAPGVLGFSTIAIALELAWATESSAPTVQVSSLLLMMIIALLGSYNQEVIARWVWWDLMRLRRARAALKESEERFEAFMEFSPVIAWIKDATGRYVFRNRAHRDRYGMPGEDWTGRADAEFFPQPDAQVYHDTDRQVLDANEPRAFEAHNRDRHGESVAWWVQKFPLRDAAGRRYVAGIGTDVTARKRAEDLVRLQSLTDELTGLYNRRGFKIIVEQQIALARRLGTRCALFFVDLDGLRQINAKHGHEGGDAALTAVGEALRVAVRNSDVVARIGGDEFIVFAASCDSAGALNERILAQVDEYNLQRTLPFDLSVSVGFTEFEVPEKFSLDHLITKADSKMYREKRGKAAQAS